MDIIQMILLAFGLSMDSLVIALTSGAVINNHNTVNVLKISGMLAFIQMSLIAIGWYVGSYFIGYIEEYDHWLSFTILGALGTKIIYDSLKGDCDKNTFNPLNIVIMFTLAVAASIDAAAVGLSLSFVNQPIIGAAVVVGIVTLILSSIGVVCGCKVGCRFKMRINLIGGIILVLIGCSILAEHTVFENHHFSLFEQIKNEVKYL